MSVIYDRLGKALWVGKMCLDFLLNILERQNYHDEYNKKSHEQDGAKGKIPCS